MLEGLNSNAWMVATYVVVALLAAFTGAREAKVLQAGPNPALVPWFWFVTSMLFAAMAVAHAGELGGAAADYARRGAYNDGWYEARRSLQVIVVAALATVWAVVTTLAIWRFPERRRRYLPKVLTIVTLMFFSAIRLVSLHHVDSLLYRRYIEGARVGVVVEFALIGIGVVFTLWALAGIERTRLSDDQLVDSGVA